jgi:hypothetical protein
MKYLGEKVKNYNSPHRNYYKPETEVLTGFAIELSGRVAPRSTAQIA